VIPFRGKNSEEPQQLKALFQYLKKMDEECSQIETDFLKLGELIKE